MATATTRRRRPPPSKIFPDLEARFEPNQAALVKQALAAAREAHANQTRLSGDPYVVHPIAVAQTLYDLQMDATTICAGLLHDTLEDTPMTEARLTAEFGDGVAALVQGVTKISGISERGKRRRQVESLRKMILAMSRDIRVVIIKLADRLHNMRTLRWLEPQRRLEIAGDTLDIYAPLALRLGMNSLRRDFEDLAMRWLQPEAYEYVAAKVDQGLAHREAIVQRFVEFLEGLLADVGIPAHEISGRPKHFRSIHEKMQSQRLSFEEVFDLIALRVVTDTVSDCYDIIGLIHGEWRPIPGRFRDYIATPKRNVYQALHTTVVGIGGETVEIQIRTREMHRVAEMGVAAHWKYKEGHGQEHELDDKLNWLRQLVDWIQDVRDPGEFLDALQEDVFADTVFTFTPQGDVIELARGATAIDFAYHIHTEIGHHCTGVRINRKMVPLRTVLSSGDVVEVITAKSAHPNSDWLAFAKTNRARNKIRHRLRAENQEANIAAGREMLLRALRARRLKLSIEEVERRLRDQLEALRLRSLDELYSEMGFGTLHLNTILNRLRQEERSAPTEPARETPPPPEETAPEGVLVAGLGNTLVYFPRCCSPVPGDEIVGFVTRGRGVSVHRETCPNLRRMITNPENADRIVEAQWDASTARPRRVEIRIVASDRTGLLADLTQTITEQGVFIQGSTSRSNRNMTATMRFRLLVRSTGQLNTVMERLRRIDGVAEITRVDRGETPPTPRQPSAKRRKRRS